MSRVTWNVSKFLQNYTVAYPKYRNVYNKDYHNFKFLAETCRVVSCHTVPCRVVSYRVVSCRIVSCRVVSQLPRTLWREIDFPENLSLHTTTQPQATFQTHFHSQSGIRSALILCRTGLYPVTDCAMNCWSLWSIFMNFWFWSILWGFTEWVRTLDAMNTSLQTEFIVTSPCSWNVF